MELARTRIYTQAGAQAIGYGEILAWAELTGRYVRPHEVSALIDMDAALRHPSEDKR